MFRKVFLTVGNFVCSPYARRGHIFLLFISIQVGRLNPGKSFIIKKEMKVGNFVKIE
jgi:hypothetical protein